VAVLTGVIAAEEHLVALYEAVRTAHSGLSARLGPLLTHHRAHLSALRRHYRPGTYSTSPSPVPTAPRPPAVPGQATRALAALRLADRPAPAARAKEVERVEPGFAQLLASIGACEAGHARGAGDRQVSAMSQPDPGSRTPGDGTVDVLQAALAAEHAAVYGYGVLGALLRTAQQQTARDIWDAHRAKRDRLSLFIAGYATRPVASAAAYRLPIRPTSPATAAQLAAALEDQVVMGYLGLVGAGDPKVRRFAAQAMQEATVRAVRWLGKGPAVAFPGMTEAAVSPISRP
jgi:hypothetical protein